MDRVRALAPSFDHVRYAKDPWEANYGVPLRYYNQLYRGGGLIHGEELPPLDTWAMMHPQPHYWVLHPKNEGSKVKLTESRFEVNLDVHQFLPDEMTCKVVENYIVVEGMHEDREDAQGVVSRRFKRRFRLPDNAKDDQLQCELSADGVLQISVPRLVDSHHDAKIVKVLPIHYTGLPAIGFN